MKHYHADSVSFFYICEHLITFVKKPLTSYFGLLMIDL